MTMPKEYRQTVEAAREGREYIGIPGGLTFRQQARLDRVMARLGYSYDPWNVSRSENPAYHRNKPRELAKFGAAVVRSNHIERRPLPSPSTWEEVERRHREEYERRRRAGTLDALARPKVHPAIIGAGAGIAAAAAVGLITYYGAKMAGRLAGPLGLLNGILAGGVIGYLAGSKYAE